MLEGRQTATARHAHRRRQADTMQRHDRPIRTTAVARTPVPPSHSLPALPAVARALPHRRHAETGRISRRRLLGAPRAELRRPRRAVVDCRAGARGAWRESHRTDVHRRSQRRLVVSSIAQGGLCESAGIAGGRRWTHVAWLPDHRRVSLRAAGEQTDNGGSCELSRVSDRDAAADAVAGATDVGSVGMGAGGAGAECAAGQVWPRRAARVGGWSGADCVVSSESAEHVYRATDGADAGRGLRRVPRGLNVAISHQSPARRRPT